MSRREPLPLYEQPLGLAEPLADLSLVTDVEMGDEPETAVRACLIATRIARALDLPDTDVADVYFAAMVRGRPLSSKLRIVAAELIHGNRNYENMQHATCEVGVLTGRRIGLSDRVVLALDQAFEQWNGKGRRKLAGDDIGLAIRIAQVAALAGLFHQLGAPRRQPTQFSSAPAGRSTQTSQRCSGVREPHCWLSWTTPTCARP